MPQDGDPRPIRLVRCNSCGLVFEQPRPPAEEIRAFYADEALWTDSTDAEGRPRSYVKELDQKRPVFDDLVRRIERYKTGGRLLDVGSGPGLLELSLDSERWEVTGVEMAPYIAEFGRRELGTNVRSGTFETADYPSGHFDVVVMKYVLDHMEDPGAALTKAREILRPDGLLVVADLINIGSLAARIFGEGHRLIHPMHFTYFSPETISAHLERAGFEIQRIDRPYLRTPYFSAGGIATFLLRAARRLGGRLLGRRELVPSPPFYGSMIDVFAVPR